jgi:hypothetical protein
VDDVGLRLGQQLGGVGIGLDIGAETLLDVRRREEGIAHGNKPGTRLQPDGGPVLLGHLAAAQNRDPKFLAHDTSPIRKERQFNRPAAAPVRPDPHVDQVGKAPWKPRSLAGGEAHARPLSL